MKQHAQIQKLKPWLEKIRHIQNNMSLVRTKRNYPTRHSNTQHDEEVLEDSEDDLIQNEELKKVKVLKIFKEKIIVTGNEYVKEQDEHANDLKSRSRLATNLSQSDFL